MKSVMLGAAALLLLPGVAWAGKCDAQAKKASSAKGEALVAAYADLLACSKDEAEMHFDSFMKASGDVDTLVALAAVTIDKQSYVPVWGMMEKIPYENREDVARGIGNRCTEQESVPTFLMGAYAGLRDVEFGRWSTALRVCESPTIDKWLEGEVGKPPTSSYDEKYGVLLQVYAKRKGADALPTLQKAATAAAKGGGPLNSILENMDLAVQPEGIGEEVSAGDRKKLEASLVSVAKGADKDTAKLVADKLFNAGAEDAAAGLLPTVYADRLEGGKLLYGAAAIEACEKEAIVHWAAVSEPGKRWSIATDIEKPLRGNKARLKCDSGEWPIVFTPEPIADRKDIRTFVDTIMADWQGKGFEVKDREEKDVSL